MTDPIMRPAGKRKPRSGHMIREVKETLDGDVRTFKCRLLQSSSTEVVVLYKLDEAQQVKDVILPAGTLSFGYFWTDRAYNAYHWIVPAGATLGIYFNISDSTGISAGQVRWRDLMVDVLVTPDGRCRVLDASELPPDLDSQLLRKIKEVREYLTAHHTQLTREVERRTAGYRNCVFRGRIS